MSPLLKKIYELQDIHTISKHEQIVQGIIAAIDADILKVGDKLPSINEMVAEVGYARKTFVKAYTELKERGLVESKNLKGYYIISKETKVTLKVALILFAFHSFQEDFYNTLRKELGKKYHIDIFFHHNNLALFKTIMDNISRKYGMYVIAPVQEDEVIPLLKTIPSDRLILIDRYLKMPKEYSYVTQEFEDITYNKLVELAPQIKKYKKFVLFFKPDTDLPLEILNAFNRFIKDHNVDGKVIESYEPDVVKKGTVYFSISDSYLWKVLKEARKMEYRIGSDIGIIAHDDNIIKEIAFGGITTISTDFKTMAQKAAKFVKNRKHIQETIPTYLRRRNSL
ncbi:GntR family transcriptional regulator [Aquimarina algicola]|uniref:GntR family transcriptional regulator n=1 Tax=Aquimarina algicola TaxID=2589995 RepID=A0A504J8W4_9FLAO|nr:GntR family transcriptional regulator [Aquimarina algicola]TPN84003.1 GntR family transcriptional regulator [Aquimarina algicola]